jgi:hypothetical protein
LQTLFRGGVALVVEAVELQRLHQAGDILFGRDGARFVGTADDFRRHQHGEDAEDDHHHHHFEQCESRCMAVLFMSSSSLAAAAVNLPK